MRTVSCLPTHLPAHSQLTASLSPVERSSTWMGRMGKGVEASGIIPRPGLRCGMALSIRAPANPAPVAVCRVNPSEVEGPRVKPSRQPGTRTRPSCGVKPRPRVHVKARTTDGDQRCLPACPSIAAFGRVPVSFNGIFKLSGAGSFPNG